MSHAACQESSRQPVDTLSQRVQILGWSAGDRGCSWRIPLPSFSQMEVSRAERLHDERQRMTRPFLQPRFNGIRLGSGRRPDSRDPEHNEEGRSEEL